ncbi:MAG: glycoside hydrolase family 28 protein [Clostridia bacterium]|nr:glycoside hydrolase family 28 protein [Clostridia bacterium]
MKFFKPFEHPSIPKFPSYEVNILDFGATEGAKVMCTDAIRAAIKCVHEAGGGRVVFPKGHYLTGPIHFLDNVELHLEDGCVLEFSEKFEDYLPVVESVLAGIKCYSCSHLIYGNRCKNIALTGNGILDGHGRVWDWMKKHQPGMQDLMIKGQECAPLTERVYDKEEMGVRPRFLQLQHCEDVLIEGVTFTNSPTWTVHPVFCTGVTVRNITIKNALDAPNSDGINFESCKRCVMHDCYVDTGDDAICIKAGRGKDAWSWNAPCEDIEVYGIMGELGRGSVTVGSETSAGINNIYIHDCTFGHRDLGINLKTMKGRGGYIKNIDFENLTFKSVAKIGVKITFRYNAEPLDDQSAPVTDVPDLSGISAEGIKCDGATYGLVIQGLNSHPLKEIYLKDIEMAAHHASIIEDVSGLYMENINIKPLASAVTHGEKIYVHDV